MGSNPTTEEILIRAFPSDIRTAALAVLTEPEPDAKVRLTQSFEHLWKREELPWVDLSPFAVPDRPARPCRPALRPPKEMPKRNVGSERGRVALLHSLAHIELNAIDLAWDLIARFCGKPEFADCRHDFVSDWLTVAAEEAEHFALLSRRLNELDARYGDHPAHDGLWEAAYETRNDLKARLAIVPMVLEARGLDVSPQMIRALEKSGDLQSVNVLTKIYHDEIGHVRTGVKWFEFCCALDESTPEQIFQDALRKYFNGRLKGPFNLSARRRAGFPLHLVENL